MTPERLFERRWVQTVMSLVLDRLAVETGEQRFEVLKDFLTGDAGGGSYEQAATRLGLTVSAVTSAIHRFRARFREMFREEIAHTAGTAREVDEEIRHLVAALSG